MVFERYVEVGRVALMNYGADKGKVVTIVDIVDGNKCLVDGAASSDDVARQVVSYSRIQLTDLKVELGRGAMARAQKKAWAAAGTQAAWDGSAWAKKIQQRKTRAGLNDFQKFKVMVAKKQKSVVVAKKLKSMKK